jgi:hypothetical protein
MYKERVFTFPLKSYTSHLVSVQMQGSGVNTVAGNCPEPYRLIDSQVRGGSFSLLYLARVLPSVFILSPPLINCKDLNNNFYYKSNNQIQ